MEGQEIIGDHGIAFAPQDKGKIRVDLYAVDIRFPLVYADLPVIVVILDEFPGGIRQITLSG